MRHHPVPHLGREPLPQHDRHQVQQAGTRPGAPRLQAMGDEPLAVPELADHRREHRPRPRLPVGGLVGEAQLARQPGQFVQLQHQERGQVGRLDHALGVEGGCVVPAAVVAVLVVGQAAARGAPRVQPEAGPGRQPPVEVTQVVGPRVTQALPQPAQCPAVDRRLDEVGEDLRVGHRVGQRPRGVLVVEGHPELVPGQVRQPGEGQGVEAVVPAPHLVHPVLRHQHRGPGQHAGRCHRRRPQDVPGQRRGRGRGVPPRGDRVQETAERSGRAVPDLREGVLGTIAGTRRAELLDRDLPVAGRGAENEPAFGLSQGLDPRGLRPPLMQHRDAVAPTGLVGGEHVPLRGGVPEEVRAGEGGQLRLSGEQRQPETMPGDPHGVGGLEGRFDPAVVVLPAHPRRVRLDDRLHPAAPQHGHQPQDRMEAGLVRDQVHVRGDGPLGDDIGQIEPGAEEAEGNLPKAEARTLAGKRHAWTLSRLTSRAHHGPAGPPGRGRRAATPSPLLAGSGVLLPVP